MNALLATNPAPMSEALAAFELLRRLDFPATTIFFAVTPGRMVLVVVDHQGKKASLPCGILPLGWDRERAQDRWVALAKAMSAPGEIDDAEFSALWRRSAMRANAERIVLQMIVRGIVPPGLVDMSELGNEAIRKFVERSKVDG